MSSLGLTCDHTGTHQYHDAIAGSAPGVPRISTFAGAYPVKFVQAVLSTTQFKLDRSKATSSCERIAHVEVINEEVPDASWTEILAAGQVRDRLDSDLIPVLDKLHRNLGHPPNHDLVRLLRHGQASEQAIRLAKEFSCDLCRSQLKPKVPLPGQPHRITEFNSQVGLDVKRLKGWLPNQKVKALNIVDTASSFQRAIPFFETETASVFEEVVHRQLDFVGWCSQRDRFGPCQNKPGRSDGSACRAGRIQIRPSAAGAYWQLGKCETHGGWFNRVLEKLIEEFSPSSKEEWLECVAHAHIKNQQLQVHGFSPYQFVFGRNPHIPQALLNEPLQVIPATASLTEASIARAQAIRTAARTALVQMQDDRALRVALLARPRVEMTFNPGDMVAYWRNQKWVQGQLQQGRQWYGVAIVLGRVGRNVVIIHRRQVLRCAPEQLRLATNEEKSLLASPQAELLGIKDLIDSGNLRSKQYIDLLPQSYPPQERPVEPAVDSRTKPESSTVVAPSQVNAPLVPEPKSTSAVPEDSQEEQVKGDQEMTEMKSPTPVEETSDTPSSAETSAPSSYGPIRRRIEGKDGPMALWRPPALKQTDFVDIMKEIVPQLVEDARMSQNKRPASPSADEPVSSRPRMAEVLSVEDVDFLLQAQSVSWACLMAEYLKKKMSKELHHSNNAPDIQEKVQLGKRVVWETILSKPNSVKIHYGAKSDRIRKEEDHRFIGSRFALTRKPLEEGMDLDPNDSATFTVKSRWCLEGHLDPDLSQKAEQGLLKSPTLSQLGRMCLFQTIGGIPGLPESAAIEVLGNIYGQNDAPASWFKEFSSCVKGLNWYQSVLDPCLFTLRDEAGALCQRIVHQVIL